MKAGRRLEPRMNTNEHEWEMGGELIRGNSCLFVVNAVLEFAV